MEEATWSGSDPGERLLHVLECFIYKLCFFLRSSLEVFDILHIIHA